MARFQEQPSVHFWWLDTQQYTVFLSLLQLEVAPLFIPQPAHWLDMKSKVPKQ